MATKDLKVAPRTVTGKNVAKLRRDGITPANIYGHKIDSTAVQVDTAELVHLMRHSSRNQIFNMTVNGESAPRTVVFRDVTRNPVTSQLLHIDFFQVSMTEKMTAQVQIVLVGESEAVSTYGGVLLQMIDTIEVSALPGDLPSQVELDVAALEQLEQSLHVRDLKLDATKVTVNTDEDVVVARVASPRLSVEGEPAAEAAEGETPVGTETPAAAAPSEGSDSE